MNKSLIIKKLSAVMLIACIFISTLVFPTSALSEGYIGFAVFGTEPEGYYAITHVSVYEDEDPQTSSPLYARAEVTYQRILVAWDVKTSNGDTIHAVAASGLYFIRSYQTIHFDTGASTWSQRP